ncbi:MAG TPA: hypothetical protein VMV09_07660 [Candidatus Saccharimonadales bacterium]|nr:hypothetical protein [Candidatus Saccharimonadales bacterium]
MIPPICAVCLREAASVPDAFPLPLLEHLVYFADYEADPEAMPGQPQGVEWFCIDHLEAAKASSHLPTDRALRIIGVRSWLTQARARSITREGER